MTEIDIDYPCSNLFQEYHVGNRFPSVINNDDIPSGYGEEYFTHPKVIAVLEAMGVIQVSKKPKLKGVPL